MKVAIFLIALTLVFAGHATAQDVDSSEIVRRADSAIAALRADLRKDPDKLSATLGLADVYYDLERWDSAAHYYGIYLKRNPVDTNARVDYAWALYSSDSTSFERSLGEIDSAIAKNPHMFNALYNAGVLIVKDMRRHPAASEGAQRVRAMQYLRRALAEAKATRPDSVETIESILYELEHPE